MTSTNITIIVGAAIIVLGGLVLIWWATGRITRSGVRGLLRFLLIPGYLIALGGGVVMTTRAQSAALSQSPSQTVSETMTLALGTLTQTLKSTGALSPKEETVLNFGTSAIVTEVNVKAGDSVHAGDVLARIDITSLEAKVRDAQLSLTQAQNSMKSLTAPASDIDIKIAENEIEAAKASLYSASQTGSSDTDIQIAKYREEIAKNQLWQAQLNRDISTASARPNQPNATANKIQSDANLASSETSVEIAQSNLESTAGQGPNEGSLGSANAQLVSAQANLDSLKAGATEIELRQAQIAIETAQLSLDQAKQALKDAVLTAPFDGVVAEVNITPGEIPSNAGAITLIDVNTYTTTLSVDEKDIAQLHVGQQVTLDVKSFSGATVVGVVTSIDPVPSSTSGLVTYKVKVTLNKAEVALRPGMTSVANVVLSQQDNVIVVPNRFITTNETTGKSTVKVETALGKYNEVAVTLGTQTDSESVITSGLTVGQKLVILTTPSTTSTNGSSFFNIPGASGGPPAGGGAPPAGNFNGGATGRTGG